MATKKAYQKKPAIDVRNAQPPQDDNVVPDEELERPVQPDLDFEDDDYMYRVYVVRAYNQQFPEFLHSWQRDVVAQDRAKLMKLKQEVVMRDGEPVLDPMGDVLVRQNRESIEKKWRRQRMDSLEDVRATADGLVDADEPEEEKLVEVDLVQQRRPKQPMRKVSTKVAMN